MYIYISLFYVMGLLLATFLDRFNFAAQLFDPQVYRPFFHF